MVARRAIRWSARFADTADLVIAPSDFVARRLRTLGVRRPIEVLPTGVDLDRFRPGDRPAARRALGLGRRRPRAPLRGPPGPREEPRVPPGRGGAGQGPGDPAASRRAGNASGRAAARRGGAGPGEPRRAPRRLAARPACPRTTTRRTPSSSRRRARPRAWPSSRRWPADSPSWRSGRAASRRSSPMASRASSCPRTPPPSRPPSTRSWPTPTWRRSSRLGGARGRLAVRVRGAGAAAGGRVPAGQGRAGVELRRDDLARAAGDQRPEPRRSAGERTEREIRQAQAEALGRTGERLQRILDRLADAGPSPGRAGRARAGARRSRTWSRSEIATRNRLRDEAARVRHHLIIQREALGFARQTPVEQCYPVPERRRAPGPAGGRGREP